MDWIVPSSSISDEVYNPGHCPPVCGLFGPAIALIKGNHALQSCLPPPVTDLLNLSDLAEKTPPLLLYEEKGDCPVLSHLQSLAA